LNPLLLAFIRDCGILYCETLLVITIGKPKETVRTKPPGYGANIRYRRDNEGIRHILNGAVDEAIVNQH